MSTNQDELTKLVRKIADTLYEYSDGLPDNESWNIPYKLKGRGSDAVAFSAEGMGYIDPRDIKWAFGKARGSLFALKETYKHACDVGLSELNPDIIVWINDAVKMIDAEIAIATANTPKYFEEITPPIKDKRT